MRHDAPGIMAKIWDNIIVTESGCWEWKRFRNALGYGCTHWADRPWMVSRLVYAATHGAFDPQLYVCHKCDNPPCCNPGHLFLGDHLANQRDMIAKGRHCQQKPACQHGHEFTPENTRFHTDKHGYVHRRCVTCERARWQRHGASRGNESTASNRGSES